MSTQLNLSRRQFLSGAIVATAALPVGVMAEETKPKEFARKIKLGLIGCGGRGSWLGDLFMKHGGYEIQAVADYFPEKSEKAGAKFGVDKTRRFSGLSGYKRLLASGVEAVGLEPTNP